MSFEKKPLVLIIMDGWGYNESPENNAVYHANTPVLDELWQNCPKTLISGSGLDVGLPDEQMGNSEVGHINLGSGRIVYQDFTRITKAIRDGDFFENLTLISAIEKAASNGKAVHLMGLLSPGGVHSHEDHFHAAIDLAIEKGAEKIYVHGFLDGRDTPPRSAEDAIAKIQTKLTTDGKGRVASIIGRYYAMDRDNRWDRVELAYQLLTQGKAEFQFTDPVEALHSAYERDENDEFVKASVILGEDGQSATFEDGDTVIFMNFRADRARQLSRSFTESDFSSFERTIQPKLSEFVMLTEYAADIQAPCAYPPEKLSNVFGEWMEKHQKTQLRISETEKYAHVTFFFNGGREEPFKGESRELIPSPKVATYDLQPEMNSELMTDKLISSILSQQYDVIICNYPNGDMVGHTGKFDAAVKACEAVDQSIGRVLKSLKEVGGECLITADHGNAEQMVNKQSGQAHTAHTSNLVPFIYVGRLATPMLEGGKLSDVAPTMLHLMGMAIPEEMTGKTLMTLK
ncbi:2,3-bisphosphoglycerate-independent phosphoglycerate mutase [Algicola sagamiensis]|uniref:2,3-bisphosphoglycerate-independent phosphoglycerate mutase n=1 Tax=Algicola sagamiensis TaxID=163869 RepID=UPI000362D7BC|nr:2,3-bisphosphoglycerate-independent phosphoglycerate mutase [Algicola sagamiensis]